MKFILGLGLLLMCLSTSYGITRAQLKSTMTVMKKQCLSKTGVPENKVANIDQGVFLEERDFMCYVACIYKAIQVIKNNKLSYEAAIKQVDMMFPAEMKDAVKAAVENCKDVSKKYKDICEASYWTAKCLYDTDPKNFCFP